MLFVDRFLRNASLRFKLQHVIDELRAVTQHERWTRERLATSTDRSIII